MTRALLCHGEGEFEIIELDEATEEQQELLIRSQNELDLINAIYSKEDDSELE